MKQLKYTLLAILLLFHLGSYSQEGEKVKLKPAKYERAQLNQDLSPDQESSSLYWEVYICKEDTQAYSDAKLSQIRTQTFFMGERFWVMEEAEHALYLVGSKNGDIPYENERFTSDAMDVGWVSKNNLLLWDAPLHQDRLSCKVILKEDVYPAEKGDVYSLYKMNKDQYLICNALRFTGESELLWVNKEEVFLLNQRDCYAPQSSSEELNFYSSKVDLESGSVAETKELDLSVDLNDLFFKDNLNESGFLHCSADGVNSRFVQIGVLDRVVGMDHTEKVALQELIDVIIKSNDVRDFTKKIKSLLAIKKLNGGNLLDLTSSYVGVILSQEKAFSQDSLKDMPQSTFESLQQQLQLLSEDLNLSSSTYTNGNGQSLYMLREKLFPATILAAYAIGNQKEKELMFEGEMVESFDLFYFDCSDPDLSFDDKKSIQNEYSNQVFKLENNNQSHMLFFSDGLESIIGEGVTKMDEIVSVLFSKSNTYLPIAYDDKLRLENSIYSKIARVNQDINLHFFLSKQMIQELGVKRPILLQELPERMVKLVGQTGRNLHVNIMTSDLLAKAQLEKFIEEGKLSQKIQIKYHVELLK